MPHHGQVFGKCFFKGGGFMVIYKLTLYLHFLQKVFAGILQSLYAICYRLQEANTD